MNKSMPALLLLMVLQGCCLSPGFVKTQRDFYAVVAPEYRAYVARDSGLSGAQKASRFDLLAAEDAVLREAEASQ